MCVAHGVRGPRETGRLKHGNGCCTGTARYTVRCVDDVNRNVAGRCAVFIGDGTDRDRGGRCIRQRHFIARRGPRETAASRITGSLNRDTGALGRVGAGCKRHDGRGTAGHA